jgi:hypothetical protein
VLASQSEEGERSMSHVPYSSVVGRCTRPDISQVVSVVSPCKVFWHVVKWILCYLQSVTIFSLVFDRRSCVSSSVIWCVDSDCWSSSCDTGSYHIEENWYGRKSNEHVD